MKRVFFTLLTLVVCHTMVMAAASQNVTKDRYLDLMEYAVQAYTPERLGEFISKVEDDCIWEHGFPRYTANLGILIAHGRCLDMKDTFEHMMQLCVRDMPRANQYKNEHPDRHTGVGNDFSIKEVCSCIVELEAAGIYPKDTTDRWRAAFTPMKAEDIYTCQPKLGGKTGSNWCVFGSASECGRIWSGMGGDRAFPDKYLGDQVNYFDENGMYRDPHEPMLYDIVTRLQFMGALYFGYDGPARAAIEENLLKSAFPTLVTQSVTGEVAFGGRSNQFLWNDTVVAAVCDYYATWFKQMGDMKAAARFKAASIRATESIKYWLDQKPVRHIKNRYPTETKYGCEGYAYFDKYMVSMGSYAFMGYQFSDDSIVPSTKPEKPSVFVTSPVFHRIFLNSRKYTVEFDVDAQKAYDSNGIGRFQKRGASPVIALSCPCPSGKSSYSVDIKNQDGLAIAPLWDKYEIVKAVKGKVVLTDSSSVWTTTLNDNGMKMVVKGEGEQTLTLPALEFDGESNPEITCDGKSLVIKFNGNECRYTTNGTITDSGCIYASRNGHLRRFDVKADGKLVVKAVIK